MGEDQMAGSFKYLFPSQQMRRSSRMIHTWNHHEPHPGWIRLHEKQSLATRTHHLNLRMGQNTMIFHILEDPETP